MNEIESITIFHFSFIGHFSFFVEFVFFFSLSLSFIFTDANLFSAQSKLANSVIDSQGRRKL